ncbi:albusnodin family lasso peptide [Streptomyces sp. NRRL B-24572]|nr:albusnodin family lasso peptide [Streptomyces sp. NRRL B-24572]
MNEPLCKEDLVTSEPDMVDVGDVAALTEGQGGGQSEDKRRAYNC